MEALLEKITNFSKEVKCELQLQLNERNIQISRLKLENDRLRDINRRLNIENKSLCERMEIQRTSEFASVHMDQILKNLERSATAVVHSAPSKQSIAPSEPTMAICEQAYDDANQMNFPQSLDEEDYDDGMNSEPEECSAGSHNSNDALVPSGLICSVCKRQQVSTEDRLCFVCSTWRHTYCTTEPEKGRTNCIYCELFENREEPDVSC